jgi:peptidoglycan/LPS O-acetylase OafA/YrhL
MVAVGLLWAAPRLLGRIEQWLRRDVSPLLVFAIPAALLVAYRLVLYPRFPSTHALVGDWYNHAEYFTVFALGFLVAGSAGIWQVIERTRWTAFTLAAITYAGFITLRQMGAQSPLAGTEADFMLRHTLYAAYQWSAIVALLGFGKRWLTRDSRTLRYLTDAVFPYYIIHQTAIIIAAFALRDAGLPFWAEASLVLLATVASCGLGYELVRRVGWLRPWFGLKRLAPAGVAKAVTQT